MSKNAPDAIDIESMRRQSLDSSAPMFKGQPWRGACPVCGSRAIRQAYLPERGENVWTCNARGCYTYDIEPVDVKEVGT